MAGSSPFERARIFRTAAQLLEARAESIARLTYLQTRFVTTGTI